MSNADCGCCVLTTAYDTLSLTLSCPVCRRGVTIGAAAMLLLLLVLSGDDATLPLRLQLLCLRFVPHSP